jgi:ribosomal protein S18 acetylase RimI-like enzyme
MSDDLPVGSLLIRIATEADIAAIEELDNFSTSPTRNLRREIQEYFGSVDPSTHVETLIFLAEVAGRVAAKAELMVPPTEYPSGTGYIKRVVVHPDYRRHGLARSLMEHIIIYARTERELKALDLHVWEGNIPAIKLYEALGFELQHRELYLRLHL